jgi:nucleoside-diphosphate-sugar epimerase
MAGREIARVLLTKSDCELTLLLHDQGRALTRQRLLQTVFRLEPAEALVRRIHLVRGDLAQELLGLSENTYRRLGQRVDGILHAAAVTRFDRPLADARRVNVGGTKNLIRFARECPQLSRFGFLSTVFVSGRRQGRILESEREHDAGFVNSYEQSKYEAEACLESGRIPFAIYRLSTLVGDSRTGFTSHFTTPHQSIRVMHLGLASLVPGLPDCSVDLIPTDWAAGTVGDLFLHRFQPGRVIHLVAGVARSYRLAEVIDESYRLLGEIDPAWKERRYPKPAIASQQAFNLLVRSAEQARDGLMIGLLGALKYFTEQFSYPKRFDTANLDGSPPAPDIRGYYGRVVAYCLQTKWGRNA